MDIEIFKLNRKLKQNSLTPYIVTLESKGWSSTKPYTQTVSVKKVTPTNSVIASPVPTSTYLEIVGDCKIVATGQGSGTVTFTAFDEKPTANVEFHILVGGDS